MRRLCLLVLVGALAFALAKPEAAKPVAKASGMPIKEMAEMPDHMQNVVLKFTEAQGTAGVSWAEFEQQVKAVGKQDFLEAVRLRYPAFKSGSYRMEISIHAVRLQEAEARFHPNGAIWSDWQAALGRSDTECGFCIDSGFFRSGESGCPC